MRTLDMMTSLWLFYVGLPNTGMVGSQNDSRKQIYISFSSQSALCNHYCLFSPPACLMSMSPGPTGFLAFRLKCLHSTANFFFWREFGLADHWSIDTEKSQRVHSDRLLSSFQWGNACSALAALDCSCTALWNQGWRWIIFNHVIDLRI